jgi:2-dehydropantoate 2-reductase
MARSILIVGSGALATLFSNTLSENGINIKILGTWPEGLQALRDKGAQVVGKNTQRVEVCENPIECGRVKYAVVLVKSWQTERAAMQLERCLDEDGLVVTLQNGLGNDIVLANILGRNRVGRGITTIGATLVAPGIVSSKANGETIIEDHPKLKVIEEILRIGKLHIKITKDATPVIWEKLMVNAAINPLAAILKLNNGELLENRHAKILMNYLAKETADVAQSLGIKIPGNSPEKKVEQVAAQTSENISSMLQDVQRGAPTEIDAINGAVVAEGLKTGVETPNNKIIHMIIKALAISGKITAFSTSGGM